MYAIIYWAKNKDGEMVFSNDFIQSIRLQTCKADGTDEHGHKRYSGYRAGSFKILPDGSIKQFLRFKKVV